MRGVVASLNDVEGLRRCRAGLTWNGKRALSDTDPQGLLSRIAQLDSCAISDALDKLGAKGYAHGILPLYPSPRVVGSVITISLRPAQSEEPPPSRHLGTAAIEIAGPGKVIAIDNAGRPGMAAWGGNLALAAKLKGVNGVVIDGGCRDVDEIRECGLPVFARAPCPMTARGRVVESSCNETVQISDVSVSPGDLVIADSTGVVFVPAQLACDVVAIGEDIVKREARIAARIRAGEPVSAAMSGDYEKMLR